MTGPEHILAWIESSRPHYDKLLDIYQQRGAHRLAWLAQVSSSLVLSAFSEMCRDGDAFAADFTVNELFDAMRDVANWELEQ